MTSRRLRRRPALPMLIALLGGAMAAGGATVLADPIGSMVGERPEQIASFTAVNRPPVPARKPDAQRGVVNQATTSAAPASPRSTAPIPPPASPTPTSTEKPPPPSSEPPPPPASALEQVVVLVNAARAEQGCGALRVDQRLTAAATAHSQDMSNRDYFAHTTPEGVTFDVRIKNAGYQKPGAENIAKGQKTAADVMDAWMKSKGHRDNILNCELTTIGVGLATTGMYWTQDFGY